MTATPRTSYRDHRDPIRTLETAMRESVADRLDAVESIAEQITALYGKAKAWAGDDLEDCLHYLDEAQGAARAAAGRLRDEMPREREYTSSQAL